MPSPALDPLTEALVLGVALMNELHTMPSSFEARRRVYEMTEAELRAFVLSETFSYMQQRLDADAYPSWCSDA